MSYEDLNQSGTPATQGRISVYYKAFFKSQASRIKHSGSALKPFHPTLALGYMHHQILFPLHFPFEEGYPYSPLQQNGLFSPCV